MGRGEAPRGRAGLDDLARIHHHHRVGETRSQRQITRDPQDRRAGFLGKALNLRDDLAWIVIQRGRSSAIISLGSFTKAMAITTRWRSPPENSCG